jgi:heme oxygenase
MSTTAAATPIGDRLKSETAELHTQAEKSPLQAAMIQGRLPREAYASFLGQMLLVHEALDRAVEQAAATHAGVRAVWSPEQKKAALVRQDLAFYGVDASAVKPLPETARVIDLIRTRSVQHPEIALGLHYVLEGANNGNQFIARVIGKVYALQGPDGLRSLDPHGPRQREVWGRLEVGPECAAVHRRGARSDRRGCRGHVPGGDRRERRGLEDGGKGRLIWLSHAND